MKTIGKYQIIEELGRGGFATVYRASDTVMGREVALKVISGPAVHEPDFRERFRQEAQTAARLHHPNIITIYDFGETGSELYLAMRLIEGQTLGQFLAERTERLTVSEALPILRQLAAALDHLHQQQQVHRDVKPANVLLEGGAGNRQVTLSDFGLVRSMEASANLTQTMHVLGSPAYMAPEQADPQKWGDITPLTDVYALGVVAYEMLTGKPPFDGEPLTLMRAHADTPPPSPLEIAPNLGEGLSETLLRVLSKPPQARFATAEAFIEALQSIDTQHRQNIQTRQALETLIHQADEANQQENWQVLLSLCLEIITRDPAHPQAMTWMTRANEGLQAQSALEIARRERLQQYEDGVSALEDEDWVTAVQLLSAVAEADADFHDVQEHLTKARQALQHETWFNEGVEHMQAEQWVQACQVWLSLLKERFAYRDGEASSHMLAAVEQLLAQLQQVKAQFQKQQRTLQQTQQTLTAYDTLAQAVVDADWVAADQMIEALLTRTPKRSQPQPWLSQAREMLATAQKQSPSATNVQLSEDTMIWEKDGKAMVRVPAGPFLFGDDKEKKELPEFWMDKTPVTNAEYKQFLDATPDHGVPYYDEDWAKPYNWDQKKRTYPTDKADHPIVLVTLEDAQAYAKWAGKRLPTEEEWEKAARGEDGRIYPWGDTGPTMKLCNFDKNEGGTTSVGQYSPQGDSPYGCVDMSGNVWEWTSTKAEYGNWLCGGSWAADKESVRSAARYADSVYDINYDSVGFRCLLPQA